MSCRILAYTLYICTQQTTPAYPRCVLGVVFYFIAIVILYKKPFLTYLEQIEKLEKRGLKIKNKSKALHLLENLSYYRLSGYLYPMLTENKENHKFKDDSTFESAFKMYCFDRELRLLVLSNLEKIEVSFRAKLTYVFANKYDTFWYTYDKLFKNNGIHQNSIEAVNKLYIDSTEDFVIKYKRKYINNFLPSWMGMEIVTFTHLSKLYENAKDTAAKAEISSYYGLPYQMFENWLLMLTYVRNICAHHSRFWNREFSIKVRKTNKPLPNNWIEQSGIARNKAYIYLSIIKYILDCINPKNSFKVNLLELFEKYPSIDYKRSMAFPENWKEQPLWNLENNSVKDMKKENVEKIPEAKEDKLHIEGSLDDVLKVSVPKPKEKETK
ncbi:MAG: Abi family protein [Bacteroidetes bacterium]|nr:Abi family protein [Bacteroidota bacterium]